ncbi:hypothetical protein MKK75_14600 [Methylobacterium sp. J-030]|uniref:hypothetical protein n=1 Tax=Methylobacterium sp. J-030 TaxID=2836627 RepID=UPI001FB8C6A6|nr:hypothetical protein [Methylobacterium sp. J-030]MCJ2070011.1 hypothetical protein [Methylobacterium sp. J-030]
MRRTKRKLPDSLTQHLSDPKVVALKPRAKKRSPYLLSGSAQKIAVSIVTLVIIVLAWGHLLHAW